MNGEDIKNQERKHNNDDPDMEEHVVDFENEERSQNDDDSDESTHDYQMERERDEVDMNEIIDNFENEMNEIMNNPELIDNNPEVVEEQYIVGNENIVTETESNEDTDSEYDGNSETNNFDEIRSETSTFCEDIKEGTNVLHGNDIEMSMDDENTGYEIRSETNDENENAANDDEIPNNELNSINIGGRSLRANRIHNYSSMYDVNNQASNFLTLGDGTNRVTSDPENKLKELFTSTVGIVMTQMTAHAGVKKHGGKAIEALLKEYTQLHDKKVFDPLNASLLSLDGKKEHYTQLT